MFGKISSYWQSHSNNCTFRRWVGSLSNLAIISSHTRSVDNHPSLSTLIWFILCHLFCHKSYDIKSPNRINLIDKRPWNIRDIWVGTTVAATKILLLITAIFLQVFTSLYYYFSNSLTKTKLIFFQQAFCHFKNLTLSLPEVFHI